MITAEDARRVFEDKFGRAKGWGPSQRERYGYYLPAEYYEALIDKLVTSETTWLDVGGGRLPFPHNPALSRGVVHRARRVVVVNPSPLTEPGLDLPIERVSCVLEQYDTAERFDLATLRMVAEHVAAPDALLETLERLVKPGGRVAVFTVNRHSPVTRVSRLVPNQWHHSIKQYFWGGDAEDTFPTVYTMNTRATLKGLFAQARFDEESFCYLDDLSVFGNWRALNWIELQVWRACRRLRLTYPENCLLGVYRKRLLSPA